MKKLIFSLFVLSNVAWSPSKLIDPDLAKEADCVHAILHQLTISHTPCDNDMKILQEDLREKGGNFFSAAENALKSGIDKVTRDMIKNMPKYNDFFTSDQFQQLHKVFESIKSICGKVIFYNDSMPQSEQQEEYKVLSNAILDLRTFNKDHDLEPINELANILVQIQDTCIMFDQNGINKWKSQVQ